MHTENAKFLKGIYIQQSINLNSNNNNNNNNKAEEK